MRRLVLSALLLSACITGEKGPGTAETAPGATEVSAPSAAAPPVSQTPKRIVGYFTNWSQYRTGCKFTAADVKPELLTHINFAFAKVDPGPDRRVPKYTLSPYEKNDVGPEGQYAQINALKIKSPSLKTFISVGGWSHNDPPTAWVFTTMAETPEGRSQFIGAAIAFARANAFDGVDIDWEYPGDPTRGGRSVDTKNFTRLLNEFRTAIEAEAKNTGKEPLLLTIAAPAGAFHFRWLDLGEIHKPLDWINLMTYDYAGGWDSKTGHNAPTPQVGQGVPGSVSAYLNFGVPADKIVVGMSTYGRSFSGVEEAKPGAPSKGQGPKGRCTDSLGMLSYFEVREMIQSGRLKPAWDQTALAPYAYDAAAKVWVSYDDERSFSKKLDFIEQKGLGGAMFWALDMDDFKAGFPLVSAVATRFKK